MANKKKWKLRDPLHGNVGTLAVWAIIVDAILSPNAHIACSGGPIFNNKKNNHSITNKSNYLPINIIPWRWSNSGNFGFSDAWPHPAQTAIQNQID